MTNDNDRTENPECNLPAGIGCCKICGVSTEHLSVWIINGIHTCGKTECVDAAFTKAGFADVNA